MSQPPSPSGERSAAAPRDPLNLRTLAWVVGGLLVLRVAAAASIHLWEDEAYYRLWGLSPQAGYYDHPPMLAWWIWIARHIAGDGPLGVRLLFALSSAATSLIVFDTARLAGASERTAVRAAIWYNATFLIGVGAFMAVPDVPATLFWALAVWAVLKSDREPSPWWKPALWWAVAGAAAGLACLSKYSALFLAPGILLWLIVNERSRAQLKTPWPWLAILVAAGLFGINIAWNADHHWLSFSKQFGRVAGARLNFKYLIELVVVQLLLINPLITAFLWRAYSRKRAPTADGNVLPFVLISAPFILYLLVHSLHDRVQAHWPAPLYAGFAIAAAMMAEHIRPGSVSAKVRAAAPWVGIGLTTLVLIHEALPGTDLPGRMEPLLQIRRWPDFARHLEEARRNEGARWIGTVSYGTAAQLSAEHALTVPVIQITERERYAAMTRTEHADYGRPGLVVDLARRLRREDLTRCFAEVTPLGQIDRGPTKGPVAPYNLFRVARPRQIVAGGCDLDR